MSDHEQANEFLRLARVVRTPEGSRKFKLPVGSAIYPEEARKRAREANGVSETQQVGESEVGGPMTPKQALEVSKQKLPPAAAAAANSSASKEGAKDDIDRSYAEYAYEQKAGPSGSPLSSEQLAELVDAARKLREAREAAAREWADVLQRMLDAQNKKVKD